MKPAIKEPWQAEIAYRDHNQARCCISYLANKLYPELPMARDREAALRADGGEIIARLETALANEVKSLSAAIDEYEKRAQ
jgi:hypothetical protein